MYSGVREGSKISKVRERICTEISIKQKFTAIQKINHFHSSPEITWGSQYCLVTPTASEMSRKCKNSFKNSCLRNNRRVKLKALRNILKFCIKVQTFK